LFISFIFNYFSFKSFIVFLGDINLLVGKCRHIFFRYIFMSALILDGKAIAAKTEQELSARVTALKARTNGQTPILATILVGDDPASATYVKMKGNACTRIGMESMKVEMPSST